MTTERLTWLWPSFLTRGGGPKGPRDEVEKDEFNTELLDNRK